MNWTLEVVCVPVTDVDRAKDFYAGNLGFHVDHDNWHGDARVVQAELLRGTGGAPMRPGSPQGLQLIVPDLKAAHAELAGRGVLLLPHRPGRQRLGRATGQQPARLSLIALHRQ